MPSIPNQPGGINAALRMSYATIVRTGGALAAGKPAAGSPNMPVTNVAIDRYGNSKTDSFVKTDSNVNVHHSLYKSNSLAGMDLKSDANVHFSDVPKVASEGAVNPHKMELTVDSKVGGKDQFTLKVTGDMSKNDNSFTGTMTFKDLNGDEHVLKGEAKATTETDGSVSWKFHADATEKVDSVGEKTRSADVTINTDSSGHYTVKADTAVTLTGTNGEKLLSQETNTSFDSKDVPATSAKIMSKAAVESGYQALAAQNQMMSASSLSLFR